MMIGGRGCQTNVPAESTAMIEIRVNGEARRVPDGLSIVGLLRHLELDPSRVAVELDRRIVKSPEWPATLVRAGSQIEIVQFVGGG